VRITVKTATGADPERDDHQPGDCERRVSDKDANADAEVPQEHVRLVDGWTITGVGPLALKGSRDREVSSSRGRDLSGARARRDRSS
jgi:hypothetical protein